MNQRDLAFEYLQRLDFNAIRNLCQSDTFYRNLCQTPSAQQIIQDRYLEYRVDKEMTNLIKSSNLEYVIYKLSDTHYLKVTRHSRERFDITEVVGERIVLDETDLNTHEGIRNYQEMLKSIPKLTSAEIDQLSQQAILPNLFPIDVRRRAGPEDNPRTIEYYTRISSYDYGPSEGIPSTLPGQPTPKPAYLQLGNVQELLSRLVEKIFEQGNPRISRTYEKPLPMPSYLRSFNERRQSSKSPRSRRSSRPLETFTPPPFPALKHSY